MSKVFWKVTVSRIDRDAADEWREEYRETTIVMENELLSAMNPAVPIQSAARLSYLRICRELYEND